ncbi:Collagen alpha-3(VI) chain [Stylophora pistillata]|uniref:Collagen alpha-3(VI) chain n=1 Tax=Stylophora pistillata TaxID=50429 RepID=A0A2B4SJQ4_STYPI|nr:Collagen alpha-3(VI) chain [Stylophora pistillata]
MSTAAKKNVRLPPISQDGELIRLPLQFHHKTRHSRELASSDEIRKFPSNKKQVLKEARFRRIISQNAEERSLTRLTDDLEKLTQLLKSREGEAQRVIADDDSEKRGNTADGNILAFDLAFVVDGSKDIDDQGTGNFKKCLQFTKEILRSFPISKKGVHTGIITYGRKALVDTNLDTSLDQTAIESVIDAIPYAGDDSYIGNALDTAMEKLFPHSGREKVAHILVLVIGSTSQDEVQSSAQELKASGIRIFCIGVGERFDQSQLDLIASSPSGTYVITTEFETLRNVVPILSSRILAALSEPTGKPTRAPTRSLLTDGGIVEAKIDLGFLIDGSNTVGEKNFRTSLDFIKAIVESFWTQFGSLHLGLVVFGADASVIFDFHNGYKAITEINNAISNATFPGGGKVMAGNALKWTETHLFGSKNQDSYKRILVVIIGSSSGDDVFLGSEMLKANLVTIFCIGVGSNFEKTQIDGIASAPSSDNVFTVSTYLGLASLKQTLIHKIEQARTTYIPPKDPTGRFQRYIPGQTGALPVAVLTQGRVQPVVISGIPPTAGVPQAAAPPGTVLPAGGKPAALFPVSGPEAGSSPGRIPPVGPSSILPTAPVAWPGGQVPGSAAQSKRPLYPAIPGNVLRAVPPLVPVEDAKYDTFVNIVSDEKLDLVFLLDGSTSITNTEFQDAKLFIKKLYSNFPIGEYSTHVGLVVFGEGSQTIFDLIEYTDKETLNVKLNLISKSNSSGNFLGRGLKTVKKSIYDVSARPGGHQVLVVIAAGTSQDDVNAPSRDLRDEGVRIFCVGVGNKVDVNQLQYVVTAPEREHLATASSDNLDTLLGPVVQNIRRDITETVVPLKLTDVKMDLVFLLDVNSNNFRRDQFSNVLNSIKSTYAPFVIGNEKTRIGVLAYDEHIHTMIPMGQYPSQQSLDIAIDEILTSPSSGESLLGQGLVAVKSQLFYGKPRPEVPKILVVISGGKSKDNVMGPSKVLKELNVTIFCIGVGQNVDRSELEAIATLPTVSHVVMATISYRETAGGNLASRIKKVIQVDLGFLVDGSSNIMETEFLQCMDIVKYIYNAFSVSKENVHVGLGVISSNPEIIFGFDKYFDKTSLDSAIDTIKYSGAQQVANIGLSLIAARDTFYSKSTRKGVRRVLVLMVKSKSNDEISDPARKLRDDGVEIYGFGIGDRVEVQEIAEIATMPTNKHVVMNGTALLVGTQNLIEKLGIAKVESTQRQAPKQRMTPHGIGNAIDLVILIDGSSNTKPDDFNQIKEVTKSIYYNFGVSPNGTHVAVAVYSKVTQIIFNLNKHYDHQGMDNDINAAPYHSGVSLMGSALRDVKTHIFDMHSRQKIPKILISVLTGTPGDEIEGYIKELKMSCVLMFALGLTSNYSPQILDLASNEPHSEYVLISETFPEVNSVAQKMANKINKVASIQTSRTELCVQPEDTKLDIVLLIGNCGSNSKQYFQRQLNFARNVIHSLTLNPQNVRFAIISVSSGAEIVQVLKKQPDNLIAVSSASLPSGGLCTFGQGIDKAHELLKNNRISGILQVMISLLDGKSDDDVSKPASELSKAGVLLYAVGSKEKVGEYVASNITSDPTSEFFIPDLGILAIDTMKQAVVDKIEKATKPSSELRPQPQSQNTTKSRQPLAAKMGPVDLVFLVEGSDIVNETLFKVMLDIVKDVYIRFPVSLNETHVAVVVYGSNTQIVFNLKDYFNASAMNKVLVSVPNPHGAALAGKALTAVKNRVFDTAGRTNESGVSRVLLHITCGKSADDVVGPAKVLKEAKVKIVAAGACPEANKMELCNIGSPPVCNNSVLINTLKPPNIPGHELANKLKQDIPVQNATEKEPGAILPNMFWNNGPSGAVVPLVPSLVPVHSQALSPAPNIWNYELQIQRNPVPPDPYTLPGSSFQYSTECIDYDPACSGYTVNGYCDGSATGFSDDYLMKMCKKSCNLCETNQDYTSGGIWIKRDEITKRRDIEKKKTTISENSSERTKRGRGRKIKKQENVKPVA